MLTVQLSPLRGIVVYDSAKAEGFTTRALKKGSVVALQCQFGRGELKDYWIFTPEHVAFFAPAQKLSGSVV